MKEQKQTGLMPMPEAGVPAEFDLKALDKFQAKLEAEPTQVKTHEGVMYVPTGILQARLDAVFQGLWSVDITKVDVVANEIYILISLSVWHPVAQVWIRRAGAAAVPIQQDQGAGILELEKKKKQAIQKNLPAALSLAIKNAAKTLGTHFGRQMNKKDDAVEDLIPFQAVEAIEGEFYKPEGLKDQVKKAKTVAELDALWKANVLAIKASPSVKRAFTTKRRRLTATLNSPAKKA